MCEIEEEEEENGIEMIMMRILKFQGCNRTRRKLLNDANKSQQLNSTRRTKQARNLSGIVCRLGLWLALLVALAYHDAGDLGGKFASKASDNLRLIGNQVECLSSETFILRNQKLFRQTNSTVRTSPATSASDVAADVRGRQVLKTAARPAPATTSGRWFQTPKAETVMRARDEEQPMDPQPADGGLQISITPRVGSVRVPVESNAILKCLISAQTNKFSKRFDIHWSRYMYDESVFEQIEAYSPFEQRQPHLSLGTQQRSRRDLDADRDVAVSRNNLVRRQTLVPDLLAPLNNANAVVDRQQQLRDFYARSRQEVNQISELLIEATLSISPVKASDNASYYCTATDGLTDQQRARIDLVALSRPVVQLERVQPARDSKSALVHWLVQSDGNTPIKKTILMVRNDTSALMTGGYVPEHASGSVVTDSEHNQWQRVDIPGDGQELWPAASSQPAVGHSSFNSQTSFQLDTDDSVVRADLGGDHSPTTTGNSWAPSVEATTTSVGGNPDLYVSVLQSQQWRFGKWQRRQRQFNLTSLLPGVTYQLRLAAINDMGQSNWTYLSATMPNEIPAQISEMFLLSRSNDSLAIGWRRPVYDNAKTIRYEMQLFDLNRTLTLDANTNTSTSSPRTNFMYVFVNLSPGTDYHFHVRACSKAGCSAFSSPKLMASTLDGEPDEPIEVELQCDATSGNATLTWLPPVNPRGQMLNYSVTLDSYAKYLNASGQWQVDEWRQTLETQDNQTLILEVPNMVQPNTNYTARVCANNRSKHCGRFSSLTARSQCYVPPELPAELPATVMQSKRASLVARKQQQQQDSSMAPSAGAQEPESLILEIVSPISRRNGTLDCIQVVLIRLPASYSNNSDQLDQFLPKEPSDIKLSSYIDLLNADATTSNSIGDDAGPLSPSNSYLSTASQQDQRAKLARRPDNERAIAYLAEEIDPQLLIGEQQAIMLGDGQSTGCPRLTTATGDTVHSRPRAYDGMLKPDTYYTGFLRLLLVRPAQPLATADPQSARVIHQRLQVRAMQQSNTSLAIKYSGYFTPVKSGLLVPEVAAPSLDSSGELLPTVAVQFPDPWNFNSQMSFQEMATRVGYGLRSSASKLYRTTTSFVSDNIKFDALGGFIMRSPPLMQLLEMGAIFFLFLLLILIVIYLVSLPGSKRRRRKRKLKRQAAQASSKSQEVCGLVGADQETAQQIAGYHNQMPSEKLQQQQQQQQLQADGLQETTMFGHQQQQIRATTRQNHLQALGYQSVQQDNTSPVQTIDQQEQEHLQHHLHHHHHQQVPQTLYGSAATLGRRRHHECPIHSSPMSQQQHIVEDHRSLSRRPSVHVCHPMPDETGLQQQDYGASTYGHTHAPSRRYDDHQQSQQQVAYATNQELARQEQYDQRNCRTIGRRGQMMGMANGCAGQLDPAIVGNFQGSTAPMAESKHMTMSHHQSSVLALAKKINKSIPLSLFGLVFECRLRNGWLKEEYEQLPRKQLSADLQQVAPISQPTLKLRPQLVVSRNDQVSALISGNELIDASSIRMTVGGGGGGGGGNTTALAAELPVASNERRYICAKSPLDADSVWDFWRLVYEQEVSTIVMLTQSEDPNTGETRCAQYWPTCDNEETTILSPCNEYVQKSTIPPAKFKIRQETLESESRDLEFKVRRLTLMVMATRPGENDLNEDQQVAAQEPQTGATTESVNGATKTPACQPDDEEQMVIVERNILHLQFLYWNTSTLTNQMRLIKFVEMANERHLRHNQQQLESPASGTSHGWASPMLVHCSNGLGRSGLVTALSLVIEDLTLKLGHKKDEQMQDHQQPKVNLFQLVARLRSQREMLLSPYRLYGLLYQLTVNYIPNQSQHHAHHHHYHHQTNNVE